MSRALPFSRGALGPRPSGAPSPLSHAQERLWLLDKMQFEETAYVIRRGFRLVGDLNVDALERSFDELIRRHESLRTRFVTLGGLPMQVVDAPGAFRLQSVDLRSSGESAGARAEAHIHDALRLGFELSNGPLIRALLLRVSDDEHLLVLSLHHIVADAWSLGVMSRELSVMYAEFSQCRQVSQLPPIDIQYPDYAAWQRQWLQGEILGDQLRYWREHLHGAPRMLVLPADRARPAMQTFAGAVHEFALDAALRPRLKEIGRQEGVTPFMVLLAAFQILLWKLSGQRDLVIGTPVAGRTLRETEGLIGFFVNTLALRTRIEPRETFRELLRRVRTAALGAYGHLDLPFEKLVEELQLDRDLSRQPLFQVMFAYQDVPEPRIALQGLTVEEKSLPKWTAKFDLTLFVRDVEGELRGAFEYATDLFDGATIQRWAEHLQVLLEEIVADAGRRVGTLSLLKPEQQRRLLAEWNQTQHEYPQHQCVHSAFREQAERTPNAVAVECAGSSLSYAQLESRSNQLARYLVSFGVGPESVVGLCVERSPEMIVGLLGILKAGGAYLPLDAEYPADRLAFMLDDAGACIVLTQESLRERVPTNSTRLVLLDAQQQEIAQHDTTPLPDAACPDNLAYIIYTSGSTGTPKGVCTVHRNILRLVKGTNYVDLRPTDRFLQLAPLSFDAATFEIWGALLNGGTLALHPAGTIDTRGVFSCIEKHRISVLWLTAGVFHRIVDESPDSLAPLRYLLAGGDVLSAPHVARLAGRLEACQLINGYGPTEATTFSTYYPVPTNGVGGGSVPIGRPLSNASVYVLGSDLNPVPIGVVGELYIAGAGLARGYQRQPAPTAERFMPDPFSPPGARMYRSGDLARYRPDGNLEFMGRTDQQTKIRGYRIEPGEIESRLLEHPSVERVVVVARGESDIDKELVAYMTSGAPVAPSSTELRAHLRKSLPEFMMPGAFVFLEDLPLTPNGKVDRGSLPMPPARRSGSQALPRTPAEEVLAQLWAHALKIESVGVDENFFELGGHSLLAMHVLIETRKALGIELSLRTLFEAPTIRRLSEHLSAHDGPRERASSDTDSRYEDGVI